MSVRVLLDAARDLFVGETCAGCGRGGGTGLLCPTCAAALAGPPFPVRPQQPPPLFPPTMAAAPYAGPVRRLLLAHKEHGRLPAVAPLARLLAVAVQAVAPGDAPLVLVPVPSRGAVRRARGHDPVARMTAAVCRLTRGRRPTSLVAALRHSRPVTDQSGLTRSQRRANLDGAFRLCVPLPTASTVVIVDDICSTGATLAAAAAAITAGSSARTLRAAVVAAPALLCGVE